MRLLRCSTLAAATCLLAASTLAGQKPTSSPGVSTRPAELLVFSALIDENWELFSWDLNAAHQPQRLTFTPYDEMAPSLAPDYSHVVYQTADGKLWRLDLKPDAKPQASPFGSDQHLDMHPAVSPDSRFVAMVTSLDRKTDNTDLIIYDQALKRFQPRLDIISYQHYPAWSPDGLKLAYSNFHARARTSDIIAEIWMVRTDLQGTRQLTLLDGYSISPRWSPNGEEIVFASNSAGNFDIWKVTVATRKAVRLTDDPAPDTNPVYSADGKWVLFVSTRSGDVGLWRLEVDSSRPPEPVLPFGKAGNPPCKDPDWK